MQTTKPGVGRFAIVLLALVALAVGANAVAADSPAPPDPMRLVVERQGDAFVLSVPVSHVNLSFPAGGMIRTDPTTSRVKNQHPRYFMFSDETSGVILTGWFESADNYEGFDAFWKSELQSLNRIPQYQPREIRTGKIGDWETAAYDIDLRIEGASNTHLRAEWVGMGTWIDVHISVTSTEPMDAARQRALKLLESLRVAEKSP